ncbi:MAG: FMN-dependent NADH-azoreductase [Angustibacter sp.]
MTRLLHLDSSARSDTSSTRRLGRELVDGWLAAVPGSTAAYRDLHVEAVPYITETWLSAVYSDPQQHDPSMRFALSRSDTLIGELEQADVLVIGAPMYNFGVPASLKAWIDQVARADRTFSFGPNGPTGLLRGKRAVVVSSSGSAPQDLAAASLDHLEPYLQALLGFVGIQDFVVIRSWGHTPEQVAASEGQAREQLRAIIADVAADRAETAG